jgi:hypothetical protein
VTLQFSLNRLCSFFLHIFFPVAILKILLFASVNNYFIERKLKGKWQFKYEVAWSLSANIYCCVVGRLGMLNGGWGGATGDDFC